MSSKFNFDYSPCISWLVSLTSWLKLREKPIRNFLATRFYMFVLLTIHLQYIPEAPMDLSQHSQPRALYSLLPSSSTTVDTERRERIRGAGKVA